ncbi:glutamine amidotransferase [Verticiella sediminum]|nr:glutamine amidotransferase [Verticiella sediminum]
MQPILILQTGNPPRAVSERHGGFDAMVCEVAGLSPQSVDIVKVYAGERPRAPGAYRAAIITGSPANVTDRLPWSVESAGWIRDAMDVELPLLGICYGHQLMADALGGRVDYNPRGRESGTRWVGLADAATDDPLLAGMESAFPAHFIHEQSVLEIPPGAIVLAANAHDAHQIVRMGPRAVGVQFHPEFTAGVMRTYIEQLRDLLAGEGADVPALLDGVREAQASNSVLTHFLRTYAAR